MTSAAHRPSDGHLSAWLDQALDPAAHSAVDAWLRDHPEDAALTRLWAAARDALRARLGAVQDEPLPAALLQALQPTTTTSPTAAPLAANRPTWRRAALAASWPHRAAVAHAVYAPEVRQPVEVNVVQGSAAEPLVGKLPREQLLALAEAVYKPSEADNQARPAANAPAS